MQKWTLVLRGALTAVAMAAVLALAPQAHAQKTQITVYTALENEQLKPYKDAFEKENPNIEIVWVRDSTGVITARFLAEKDNPKADVIWGLGASSINLFKKMGLLEPYAPKGLDAVKPIFKDAANPPAWTGMDAWLAVVCFNTAEAGKDKIAAPKTWADLTKPEFKGKIVMPHPASSGTGYLAIYGWMQAMGEEKAWKFMDALHENIAVYLHSGSAPCVQAAKGERLIGIGFDMRGASEKTKGAPIDLIVPTEGVGWDMEATAIVKGTKNLDAAKKVADFAVSKAAYEMYAKYYAIVGDPNIKAAPQNYPPDGEKLMLKMDLVAMGEKRDEILKEWSKRYESKAAKK